MLHEPLRRFSSSTLYENDETVCCTIVINTAVAMNVLPATTNGVNYLEWR